MGWGNANSGGGGGASLTDEQSKVLSAFSVTDDKVSMTNLDKDLFVGSVHARPGSFHLGPNFTISSGMAALALTLGDVNKSKALGLNVKYDNTGSTHPTFPKLAPLVPLNVNTDFSQALTSPIEVSYTTVGYNLTVDFDFYPLETGTLRVQFWLGTSDAGALVFDEQRTVLAGEVGNITRFGQGNHNLLKQGISLFARF
ncbi:MAG: hypothetical protein GY954_10170, partial [Alteromonas sp.]|nr:hypothetical protein [Alteromonas sp.]